MEAISSADFKHNEEEKPAEALNKTPNKYDDILNKTDDNSKKNYASDKPKVSSF
jgi:hypothetical protein